MKKIFKYVVYLLILTACNYEKSTVGEFGQLINDQRRPSHVYKEVKVDKQSDFDDDFSAEVLSLNISYKTLNLSIKYVGENAYIKYVDSLKFTDWNLVNINFYDGLTPKDTETRIHVLLNESNFTKGYILFPSFSQDSILYSFYSFNKDTITYLGEYSIQIGVYSVDNLNQISFYYNEDNLKLYSQFKDEINELKLDSKQNYLDVPEDQVKRDIHKISTYDNEDLQVLNENLKNDVLKEYDYDINEDNLSDKIIVFKNNQQQEEFDEIHFGLSVKILKATENGFIDWGFTKNLIFNSQNNCISEGFQNIVFKDNYFTIEQNTCFDYNISVSSYTTFKIVNDEIFLYKYGEQYFDKADHDKIIPPKTWTEKDFGKKRFEEVSEDFLKKLRYRGSMK